MTHRGNLMKLFFKFKFRSSWKESLENNTYNGGKKLPSENLLDELNIRMCNVEVLCDLLKDCNLLGALSVLQQPGILL